MTRGFANNNSCPRCNCESESIDHLLRGCVVSKKIWEDGDNTAVLCAWNPPLEGWIKLNVDGGRSSDLGVVTAGGVLRDYSRNWMRGFAARKGIGSVLEAELWGLLESLKITWDRGFRRVIIETDSIVVVDMMKKGLPIITLFLGC
ncbi:hypothetical protein ACOSQ2_010476 [Xanthoceras sorbifolium]